MHKHKSQYSRTRPFFGPVALPENKAAHGNVCIIDVCSCGAERFTNVNQKHIEKGRWIISASETDRC